MQKMRDYHFSPVQMAFLDARVLYANDDWKAAREGFEKVRPKLNDSPQLMKCLDYWIGYCYLQQGNPDQAMAAFRRSLSFDKFYFKAHDGIAQIFIADGQLQDAAEEYRQAAIGNPVDAEAWQAFARTLVLLNLRRSPAEQNWDEVEGVLQQAVDLNPHDGQIKLLMAEMLLAQGQGEGGRRTAQGSSAKIRPRASSSGSPRPIWLARQGDLEQAKKILDEAKAKLGDNVLIRLAQAAILLRELGLQAGSRDREAGRRRATAFSAEEKTRLWNGLMNNLMEIKEYDRAKRLCRQIADVQPHDAIIRYRLFELALVTHDARDPAASLAELDRVLEEIDDIAGQGPLWLYGKAVRLKLEAAQGKPELLDDGHGLCQAGAAKCGSSWSRPHVLQGRDLPPTRQERGGPGALFAGLDQRRSRSGLHPPPVANALRAAALPGGRAGDPPPGQQPNAPDRRDQEEEAEILAIWGDFDRALESANEPTTPPRTTTATTSGTARC